jgi:undecaprenyl diphosphate synthase
MADQPGIPRHIAIVMDGNGRWAQKKSRPRTFGHQAGLKALRKIVEHCGDIGVEQLTVFAFSSENWNRPASEVSRLMELLMRALDREARELHEKKVRIRFIGDLAGFSPELRQKIDQAMRMTADNGSTTLNVAANYGGRWDIRNAAQACAEAVQQGRIQVSDIDEQLLAEHMSLDANCPPDLLIRTGGEMRISNFLLWQLAYTELYFSPLFWPEFTPQALDEAIATYQSRERRFGMTGEQIRQKSA